MSLPPFNPKDIWDRVQTGEWDADPKCRILHQAILQSRQRKQRSARSIAQNLQAGNTADGPVPRHKTPNIARANLTEHQRECLDAYDKQDTAYFRKIINVFTILKKKESLEQRFSTFELTGLGVFHLDKICGQKPIRIDDLQEHVVKWQRDYQQRTSQSTRQWERAIARPEIRAWLPPVVKSPKPRKHLKE
jgi:hypothetical protein